MIVNELTAGLCNTLLFSVPAADIWSGFPQYYTGMLTAWYCSLGQCCDSGDCRITNNITGRASHQHHACIILYKYSGFYNSGNPRNIRKFKQKILEMSEHLLKWISLINAYFRIGKRSPGEASWAAPGPVCGSESHSGIHQQPWVQQTTDSVLSRLVRYRKELCGPDSRGQPVPGWYKEWMCAFVHCSIPLPSREIGGRVQGEQRFNIWRPHSCPGHLIWFSSRLLI